MHTAVKILTYIGVTCGVLSLICIMTAVFFTVRKNQKRNLAFLLMLILGTVFAIVPVGLFFTWGIVLLIIFDIILFMIYIRR